MDTDDCSAVPAGIVTYSTPSGTFQGSVEVRLTATASNVEIRYTTDRTPPTASSMLYAGTPLTFSSTTELRARAFVDGVAVGSPEVAVYVARAFDQMHDLPLMVLDSYGQPLPAPTTMGGPGQQAPVSREYMDVAVLTFEVTGMNFLAARPRVATTGGFHIRGQSSASYPKRPYRLETRDAVHEDRDCPMLGMPAESDWVLHSPYPDKALIRNAFVYSLGPDIGLAAPRAAFVELYLNTAGRPLESADYQGVYLLVETIKNQKNRLNLQQLEPEDTELPAIAGGYIFKFEWQVMNIEQQLGCPEGQQNCWNWLEVADPKPWNQPQQDYLTGHLSSFVDALNSTSPADSTTGYPAFIDTASWVNQVILHELTRNLDAYTRSQFFHKDRTGPILAGPLWDYDLIAGVGISSGNSSNMAIEGWQYESNASRFVSTNPSRSATADWFPLLLADPAFQAALVARWKELRQGVLSDAEVSARIERLSAGLTAGAGRNFQKWNILTTSMLGFFQTPTFGTWQEHVSEMQAWLIGRMAWLDSQWQ